jgi:mannose-6-phosphate isomerase
LFLEITNTARDYDWGSTRAIPDLLGRESSGEPEAELWLGDHPASPARVVDGTSLAERLSHPLSFLLKVIAPAAPLSLQVHPGATQAAEGFRRENAAGIPVDSPLRTYRDPFPKPELIYSLSVPFRALVGFRPVAEVCDILGPVSEIAALRPLLDRARSDDDLAAVVEWLLSGEVEVGDLLTALVDNIGRIPDPVGAIAGSLASQYPGDPAVVVAMFLNPVDIAPGEVVFIPPGTPHAYLEGLGIELMGSSDNVVRGGLTSKHVDIGELVRVMDFAPSPVRYCAPEAGTGGVLVFEPEDAEISLTRAELRSGGPGVDLALDRPSIILCTAGEATTSGGRIIRRGASWFVSDEPAVSFVGDAEIFIATGGRG